MPTRTLLGSKKKWITQRKQQNSLPRGKALVRVWLAWGLEALMLLSSLFWTIEANAGLVRSRSALEQRLRPQGWFGYHDYNAALESRGFSKVRARLPYSEAHVDLLPDRSGNVSGHVLGPLEEDLSLTFKGNPLYVPSELKLMSFGRAF